MALANVTIHSSQFPENVRRDLLHSLHTRQITHKFLYDSYKQAQKWLALHEACSPSRTDPACQAMYDRAFADAAGRVLAPAVQILGLGCGGGQKDARLLSLLAGREKEVSYRPCDVSLALALTARQTARQAVAHLPCDPLVCDLALADDLHEVFGPPGDAHTARLITFFGMLPNFEPELILPRLAALVRGEDWLLLSANLAPGPDYTAGVERILPLYDNALTREWLMTFLFDLGVERTDGELRFVIETPPTAPGLKRIAAYFDFRRRCEVRLEEQRFEFPAGDSIRLFFSYRHTPELVRACLRKYELEWRGEWIARSGEEGLFLMVRA